MIWSPILRARISERIVYPACQTSSCFQTVASESSCLPACMCIHSGARFYAITQVETKAIAEIEDKKVALRQLVGDSYRYWRTQISGTHVTCWRCSVPQPTSSGALDGHISPFCPIEKTRTGDAVMQCHELVVCRDLISSADTILAMANTCNAVVNNVAGIQAWFLSISLETPTCHTVRRISRLLCGGDQIM